MEIDKNILLVTMFTVIIIKYIGMTEHGIYYKNKKKCCTGHACNYDCVVSDEK